VIEILATHGVVEQCRENRFGHKNLVDIEWFSTFLKSTQKCVPLAAALQGHGKALTIDDVTLFINPWQIEAGRPYPASRMDALLDQVDVHDYSWDGRDFHLDTVKGKRAFRTRVKEAIRRHTAPEENERLLEELERGLGVSWADLPGHMRCLTFKEVERLRDIGVQVENHYWTHLDPWAHSPTQFAAECGKAKRWLSGSLGISSRFFASPFGEFVPSSEFLQQNETVCLLLHDGLPSGMVAERIINRITLKA